MKAKTNKDELGFSIHMENAPVKWSNLLIWVLSLTSGAVGSVLFFRAWLLEGFGAAVKIYLTGIAMTAILVCMPLYGHWWWPEYKGNNIHVRTLRSGGWDTRQVKTEFSGNIFANAFVFNLSCLLVPLETNIWELVLDNDLCAGVIAQELNHGVFQMIMNISASKQLGYPSFFWVKFYSWLFRILPQSVVMCLFGLLESGFTAITFWIPQFGIFNRLFPQPHWLLSMHLLEECEHSWSSMADYLEIPFYIRFGTFLIGLPIFFVLIFVVPLVEGFAYGVRLHNIHLVPFHLVEFFAMMGAFIAQIHGCNFLHLVLGMRPSDSATLSTLAQYREWFEPQQAEAFRFSHVQKARDEIARRKSLVDANDRRVSVYMYQKEKRMSLHQGKPDPLLSMSERNRHGLILSSVHYNAAMHQLRQAGLSDPQIKDLFMEDPLLLDEFPKQTRKLHQPEGDVEFLNSEIETPATARRNRLIPREEIVKHNTKESLWIIVRNMVIDVTQFQHEHPGGAQVLLGCGGRDATLQFSVLHSTEAKAKLMQYIAGQVKPEPRG